MSHETSPCPSCRAKGYDQSGDNLVRFIGNNTSYCFRCKKSFNSNNIQNKETRNRMEFKSGKIVGIPSRGISKDVCEWYDYRVYKDNGQYCHIENYKNSFGEIIEQRIRQPVLKNNKKSKKFFRIGGEEQTSIMYGSHLYEPSDKIFITITEGVIDCLSVAEVMGKGYPCISIKSGSSAAYSEIKNNLKWLSGFKYVVLCFDMDEAGQKAAKECAELFEYGKVKICHLPKNDANDMLVSGLGKELKQCIFGATTPKVDCVLDIDKLANNLYVPKRGASFPWPSLDSILYGFREYGLYIVGAGAGIGKTSFINEIVFHHCFNNKGKVGYISLEDPADLTLLKMAGGFLNKKIHIPDSEFNKQEVVEVINKLKPHIELVDTNTSGDIDSLISNIRYLVKGLDCDLIVIDPFTYVRNKNDNERLGIDASLYALRQLTLDLKVPFLIAQHLNQPKDGLSWIEGRKVKNSNFRGSGAFDFTATYLIGLSRDVLKDTITVSILKDKQIGEAAGKEVDLFYNNTTGRLIENVEYINIGEYEV